MRIVHFVEVTGWITPNHRGAEKKARLQVTVNAFALNNWIARAERLGHHGLRELCEAFNDTMAARLSQDSPGSGAAAGSAEGGTPAALDTEDVGF